MQRPLKITCTCPRNSSESFSLLRVSLMMTGVNVVGSLCCSYKRMYWYRMKASCSSLFIIVMKQNVQSSYTGVDISSRLLIDYAYARRLRISDFSVDSGSNASKNNSFSFLVSYGLWYRRNDVISWNIFVRRREMIEIPVRLWTTSTKSTRLE